MGCTVDVQAEAAEEGWKWVRYGDIEDDDDDGEDFTEHEIENGQFTMVTDDINIEDDYDDTIEQESDLNTHLEKEL